MSSLRRITIMLAALMLLCGAALAASAPNPLDISKSKSAKWLEKGKVAEVKLGLPSAEKPQKVDVAVVIDGSTSSDTNLAERAKVMLEAIGEHATIDLNVSLTIFGGTRPILYSSGQLYPKGSAGFDEALAELVKSHKQDTGRSGSNLQAGLRDARRILSKSSLAARNKYILILSDMAARTWVGNGEKALANDGVYAFNTLEDFNTRYGGASQIRSFVSVYAANASLIDRYAVDETTWNERNAAGSHQATDTVMKSADYYPNLEAATWYAARELKGAVGDGINVLAVTYKWSDGKHNDYIEDFKSWIEKNGVKRYDLGKYDVDDAVQNIRHEIVELVDVGTTVEDVMGKPFDFAGLQTMRITRGRETLVRTVSGNSAVFADANGVELFHVSYDKGRDTLMIEVCSEPITKDKKVEIIYKVIVDPKALTSEETADGLLDTNERATLTPVDSDGHTGDPEDFPKPRLPIDPKPVPIPKTGDRMPLGLMGLVTMLSMGVLLITRKRI